MHEEVSFQLSLNGTFQKPPSRSRSENVFIHRNTPHLQLSTGQTPNHFFRVLDAERKHILQMYYFLHTGTEVKELKEVLYVVYLYQRLTATQRSGERCFH